MITEKEAELIGMHVGDGTLYKTGKKSIVWELRGSVEEKEYYEHVSKLLQEIFNLKLEPKFRKPNAWGIQTSKKEITSFFINNGFIPGTKTYTVRIPDYIKNSDIKLKLAFVRGLFDTDGCLRFEKNRTPFRYYPRIEFGFASKMLVQDLFEMLSFLGFRVYRWEDRAAWRLGMAGKENLNKWMKEVAPSNSKHFKKVKTS